MTLSPLPTMRETLLFEEHGNSIVASSKPEEETTESFRKSSSSHISRGGNTKRVAPTSIGGDVEKLLPNGDLYTGSFNANVPHGSGKYLWRDGCMYEGEWRKGKASGKGRFSWPSGATFEGEFKSGRMEGFGNFIGSDGDTYRGSWSSDRKNGYGQKMYANGDSYEGSWRRNIQDGRGRYVWGNGNSYSGEWKNGVIYGRGVLIWANGNRYEGCWDHGVPKGNGVFRWPDGSCLVGSWNKDFSSNVQPRQLQGRFYPTPMEFQNDTTECFFPLSARKRLSVESERSYPRICIWESDDAGGDITCDIVDNVELYRGFTSFDCDGFRQFWRRPCSSRKSNDAKKPGETIFKGHKNYGLMLSLQVGIRYSVGKHISILRDLKPGDFDPRQKFALRFPPEGSKITPPHQSVEFRWKDYCPLVFRHLRELFHVDPADYMLAICGNDALRELCSPGKSGSFFYLTQDDRFMIKTVKKSEVKVLIRMLSSYFQHVCRHENSLVTKFYGVHSIKPIGSQKTRFIVMGNLFCSEYPIHRRFDLKGSSHGRITDKPDYEIDETTTLKDLDLNYVFHLHKNWFQDVIRQIDMDCEFLEAEGIMDYSLLVGLHFCDNVTGDKMDLSPYLHYTGKQDHAYQKEKLLNGCGFLEAELQNMDQNLCGWKSVIRLGANMPARVERRARISSCSSGRRGDGGFGDGERFEVVLYFGIIDILQDYDISKKLEHAYKSFQVDPSSISAVGPKLYSKRFREFIGRIFVEDR